jgi:hypothetical protein
MLALTHSPPREHTPVQHCTRIAPTETDSESVTNPSNDHENVESREGMLGDQTMKGIHVR